MTSLTIPSRWLKPVNRSDHWIFRCSVTIGDLVQTQRAGSYFRQLVTLLEHDHQLVDYHLKFRHNYTRNNELDILIYFGNPNRASNPSPLSVCISCEPTHELCAATLLSEQQYTRAWLDARARQKLILTPIRHVERLSELTDEDGEMDAFWYDALELIKRECDQGENFYPDMILNHGTYRNHAHLHLKINIKKNIWDEIVVSRHHEKFEQIKRLSQMSSIRNECFGQSNSQKAAQGRIQRKTYTTLDEYTKSKT